MQGLIYQVNKKIILLKQLVSENKPYRNLRNKIEEKNWNILKLKLLILKRRMIF